MTHRFSFSHKKKGKKEERKGGERTLISPCIANLVRRRSNGYVAAVAKVPDPIPHKNAFPGAGINS
jgi:hypothetical protein